MKNKLQDVMEKDVLTTDFTKPLQNTIETLL